MSAVIPVSPAGKAHTNNPRHTYGAPSVRKRRILISPAGQKQGIRWSLDQHDKLHGWRFLPSYPPARSKRWSATCRASAAEATGGSWPSNDGPAPASAPGSTMPQTVFNLVNVIMGAGYVSIPFALKQGGWAALGVLWLLGLVFGYTGLALLDCCRRVEQLQQGVKADPAAPSGQGGVNGAASSGTAEGTQQATYTAGYEEVAAAAFGPVGKLVVSGIMYAELLGICCVYVTLEAEALSTLLAGTSLGASLSATLGTQASALLAIALMLPTVLLPSLEALSLLGAIGVAAAAAVGFVLAGLFVSGAVAPVVGPRPLLAPATLPSVLGILAFVYAGHSTFPVIQQSMGAPAKGPRAVALGYVFTALICTQLGLFGYLLYGPAVAPVITACLPAATALAVACTALTACNPFSAFAVTLEPVALAVQQLLAKGAGSSSSSGQTPYSTRALIRLGLAAGCAAIALNLPYVADLMALVGALLTMSISLILPALMHLRLFGPSLSPMVKLLDVVVVLLGLVCAAVGASSALNNIGEKMAAAAVAATAG